MASLNVSLSSSSLRALYPSEEVMGWEFFQGLLSTSRGADAMATLEDAVRSGRRLSLEGFKYLNHEGLLWLILLCSYLRSVTGVKPTVALPTDQRQSHYSLKVGIEDAAAGVLDLANYPYPAPRFRRDRRWRLSTISRVDNSTLPKLISAIDTFTQAPLARMLGVDAWSEEIMVFAESLRVGMVELCRNVVQHSMMPEWTGQGYVIMRSMPRGFPLVRLMVGDVGVGLRRRLGNMGFHTHDDEDAIRQALCAQAMRSPGHAEGLGRAEGLLDIVQYTARRGGSLTIRSGGAIGRVKLPRAHAGDKPSDTDTLSILDQRLVVEKGHAFAGVQVLLELQAPEYLDRARKVGH